MFRRQVKLLFWMFQFTVPLALVGMLAIPFLLRPPADAEAAAKGSSPQATLIPVGAGDEALQTVSWEDFFDKFEREKLAFLHQDQTDDGQVSRFCKFVSREG